MMNSVTLENLPDSIILEILYNLTEYKDVLSVSLVCRTLYKITQDELLWKKLILKDYHLPNKVIKKSGRTWKQEYQRLTDEVPLVESEVLEEHTDEVIHVSFSHEGSMFCTTSKDATFVVWSCSYPSKVLHYRNMKKHSWRSTLFSQFNPNDDLLLVSGFFKDFHASGEIAIFSLDEDGLHFQCRASNKPYDTFGNWFNEEYFISAELLWLGGLSGADILWLNRANQESDSEHRAVVSRLCQFYQTNGSCVRCLRLANIQQDSENSDTLEEDLPCDISAYAEKTSSADIDFDSDNESSICSDEHDSENKILIFTTGSDSCSPHEIGVKYLKNVKLPKDIYFNHNIKELIERHKQELQRANDPIPNEFLPDKFKDKFDGFDHRIDCECYIVDMCLSPNEKNLYVNTRPWVTPITNPYDSPVISEDLRILAFEVKTMKKLDFCLTGHKGKSQPPTCTLLFLDSSKDYITSGSEDNCGYLWDEHYQKCLIQFPHSNLVSCMKMNPADEEVLVSACDDGYVRVFRSFRRMRELGLSWKGLKLGRRR